MGESEIPALSWSFKNCVSEFLDTWRIQQEQELAEQEH